MRVPGGGEKGWSRLLENAPRPSALVVSVFAHVAALAIIILLQHTGHIHIKPVTYAVVRIDAGRGHSSPAYLPAKPGQGQPLRRRSHISRQQFLSRQLRITIPDEPKYQGSDAVLDSEAKRWTSAITKSLNFHRVYLNHEYELAVLISGDLPFISADELPLHFQSYVTIEVTIDAEGIPAHVHTIAGIVTPVIEQKLLAAIRRFRYIPAKRDGLPVPSQRDIVIHIPT